MAALSIHESQATEVNDNKLECDVKLVLLGESFCGKTSLITRLVTGEFHNSNATIGAAFLSKTFQFDDSRDGISKTVQMDIWDTAGQERYRSLTSMYYRNTDIALIVFDVTEPESYKKAKTWIEELHSTLGSDTAEGSPQIYLVANKKDLLKESSQEVAHWEEEQSIPMRQVSAKTGEGVGELFDEIVKAIPADKFLTSAQRKSKQLDENKTVVLNKSDSSWKRITHRSTCEC